MRRTSWVSGSPTVVEDEPLIALDVAQLLQSQGAQVVAVNSRAEAKRTIDQRAVCAAVLDYRLGAESVEDLCELLPERRIPYMLWSGCSDLEAIFRKDVVIE